MKWCLTIDVIRNGDNAMFIVTEYNLKSKKSDKRVAITLFENVNDAVNYCDNKCDEYIKLHPYYHRKFEITEGA